MYALKTEEQMMICFIAKKEVLPSAYRVVQVNIEKLHGGKAVLREFTAPMTKAVGFER